MTYQVSNNTLNLIKRFEGCELHAYKDQIGISTIGYGITYYAGGTPVCMGDTITQADADRLLRWQAGIKLAQIQPHLPIGLTDHMVGALLSLTYNIGVVGFLRSTLLRTINENKLDPQVTADFEMWNKAGGKVLEDLVVRRKQEAAYYFS